MIKVLNETLGQDYSNIPLIDNFNFINKKSNMLPGIIPFNKFIDTLNNVGYDEFKVRTSQFGRNISLSDINDEWLNIKRNGWSIIRDWDTSISGFNEVYICKKI